MKNARLKERLADIYTNTSKLVAYPAPADAPMSTFDFEGSMEVEIEREGGDSIGTAAIRPLSYGIHPVVDGSKVIADFDERWTVDGVTFRNLSMNGVIVESAEEGDFECNAFARNVSFCTGQA